MSIGKREVFPKHPLLNQVKRVEGVLAALSFFCLRIILQLCEDISNEPLLPKLLHSDHYSEDGKEGYARFSPIFVLFDLRLWAEQLINYVLYIILSIVYRRLNFAQIWEFKFEALIKAEAPQFTDWAD